MSKKINYAERQSEVKEALEQEFKAREHEDILREWSAERKEYIEELSKRVKIIETDRLMVKKFLETKVYSEESYIQKNIKLDVLGLSLVKYEYATEVGYIDILCNDELGRSVVIEVKAKVAGDSAVGQILGYMNSISKNCRGIIVARDFTDRVKCAVKYLNIDLVDYRTLL